MSVPEPLLRSGERSAAPRAVEVSLARLIETRPESVERLVSGAQVTSLGKALVTVLAASRSLSRLCLTEPSALDVLDALGAPVPIDSGTADALVLSKRLELLRIAARDLLGIDELEDVGAGLAKLADDVLEGALGLIGENRSTQRLAVIGMGKLGGRELNYSSDVDVVFATSDAPADDEARRLLSVARLCFRVDANLRPDGRSGQLTRPVEGFRVYWQRRAATWELQSLIKARHVAGDVAVGRDFAEAASSQLWGRTYSADDLAEVRRMKARAEQLVEQRGLSNREIKRGPGGIRDIEFAVQLLQLVHGRQDELIRDPSTLGALSDLSGAGYIAVADATVLERAYRFLRAVEHRLQLVEEEQTHEVPADADARSHLARVLGFVDSTSSTATEKFDDALRVCQSEVRAVHQRLFFRPLLEAFAAYDPDSRPVGTKETEQRLLAGDGVLMDPGTVERRLAAFGFADASRTRAAVRELAGGLTRSSRLMAQLLPLILDWLSLTADPDLGLLGLRNLVLQSHQRTLLVETFRESPEAARRLCLLLGSSRALGEYINRNPELIRSLAEDESLAPSDRDELVAEAVTRMLQRDGESRKRAQLVRFRQDHMVRVAARDLLGIDDVGAIGAQLSSLAEAILGAALSSLDPPFPFCVIGMGRLGGRELSYASDLDVLFVHDADPSVTGGPDPSGPRAGTGAAPGTTGASRAEQIAETLLHFMHGPSPAQRVATVDLGLRPEGAQGRLARDLGGYAAYFARWAQTWERQAMLRARFVAGDRALAERFMALADAFVWDRDLTDGDIADIRRMKARMERERIPAREDPQFHLKLGRGSLSDIEWTVQLLQLRLRVEGTGTVATLDRLEELGALEVPDAKALRESYRFCERTRNRWYLVGSLPGGGAPGDALPSQAHQLSRLARSLDTTPAALRDEYRRVTRRARRVMERVFYGIEPDQSSSTAQK